MDRPLDEGTLVIKPAGIFVYTVRDWADAIIYIGMTNDICRRMTAHSRNSVWWPDAAGVTWELWPTRPRAAKREAELIKEHRPVWNIVLNGPRPRPTYERAAWLKVGETVRVAREARRETQTSLAATVGADVRLLRALERGEGNQCSVEVLAAVELALKWHPGSILAVLEGGQIDELTAEERATQLRELANLVSEVRGL